MLRTAWAVAFAGVVAAAPAGAQVSEAQDDGAAESLRVALASAIVPGAGQFMQGRRRWIVFLAAEAVGWAFHVDAHQDGRRYRAAYRDLAWSVARGAPEPRMDGDFEYYERMGRWLRSGAFDSDPGSSSLDPERDPETYNGTQWELASSIFLDGDLKAGPGTPGYDDALDYYRHRAYGDGFLWDWTAQPEEQDRFVDLIDWTDDRFQAASIALAAVAGNHLLSAVDAYVASRAPRAGQVSFRLVPDPHGQAAAWLTLRWLPPRLLP